MRRVLPPAAMAACICHSPPRTAIISGLPMQFPLMLLRLIDLRFEGGGLAALSGSFELSARVRIPK